MKTYGLVFVIMILASVSAEPRPARVPVSYPGDTCWFESTTYCPGASPTERIRSELLTAVWTEYLDIPDTPGMKRTFQFHENGTVRITTEFNGGRSVIKNERWALSTAGQDVLLELTDPLIGQGQQLSLAYTCDGMLLTDLLTADFYVLYHSPAGTS